VVFFLFTLLLTACGNNKDQGIEAVFVADFSNEDPSGDSDSYPDNFLSPNNSIVTVGVKSVMLIKSNETSPSYTVFDTNSDTQPIVLDLTTVAQAAGGISAFPSGCPCDYGQVQIELTYFEIQIPVFPSNVSTVAQNQRFRFYTLPLTDPALGVPVDAGDVLIGNATNPPQFSWIDTSDGAYISLALSRPTVPLQVPASRFPDHTYDSTVTINLPTFLHIPSSPKGAVAVKLTVHAGGMFFYDDTNGNGRFDAFPDGQLNGINPNSHFYPVYPTIDAASGS
jgi:hypothetical protein